MDADGKLTITIVDDDAALLGALAFAFKMEGRYVRTYESAEALLAETDPPERGCLVVDHKLSGIDGLDLLTRLRSAGSRQPAILITTPSTSLVRRAAAAGIPIIEKPLMSDALYRAVDALLIATYGPDTEAVVGVVDQAT
jgi:FixJ family two-component response regulator